MNFYDNGAHCKLTYAQVRQWCPLQIYSATDAAGNTGTAERTVEVVMP
jgi:hypothetical protein